VASISFRGVSKRFGAVSVLEGLDLTIEDREFFTFVGPSGCGKSTVLNLVAGLERPSAGQIAFDGRPVDALPPGERDVAMVFQSYALYPHLSVFENLAFPLRVRRRPRAEVQAAVEAVARSLGLEALLARRPRELSGGQRQRVALGRALVRSPRVFLMDEPLSNLDARLRLEMREEIKRLHARLRTTTVYVTHDQEEAMVLSDRLAVLQGGRVQQCGTPLELYEDPANLFVAGFIGSPPMNLLEGEGLAALPAAGRPRAGEPAALVAGVRPADVTATPRPEPGAVEAELTLVEATGAECWVVGRWRGQRLTGRGGRPADWVDATRAFFRIPPERIYLFDRATGARRR
jgi:multiple sugar transport system ATP-binding protein